MVDTTASEDGSIASESQGNEESLATIQTLDSNDIGVSIGASVDPIEYIKTTRNVASMRASLFGPSPSKTTTKPIQTPVFEKRSGDAIQEVKNSRPLFSQFPAVGGNHTTKYQKQEEPKVLKKVDLSKPVDLNTSLVNNTKLFVDAAYFQGRSFRASFSNNGILIPNQ
jgi:hypothetical protein